MRTVAAVLMLLLAGCAADAGDKAAVPASSAPPVAQGFPEPATTQLEPAKAQSLQTVLDKIVSRYAATPDAESASRGATAAVVTDRWTWSGAAGQDAVGTTLSPTTGMGVASITKTFVAAEVMKLAKEKKVDLDAPLSEQFGIGTAVGHRGELPDHTSLLVVIPEKKVSVALLLADGNKNVDTVMTELVNALQPLLG